MDDDSATGTVERRVRRNSPTSCAGSRGRGAGEFHLTRKEAETALGLYTMGSVEELARYTDRSLHTVRTQLKAAMQKTGTHTQASLVALVANRLSG